MTLSGRKRIPSGDTGNLPAPRRVAEPVGTRYEGGLKHTPPGTESARAPAWVNCGEVSVIFGGFRVERDAIEEGSPASGSLEGGVARCDRSPLATTGMVGVEGGGVGRVGRRESAVTERGPGANGPRSEGRWGERGGDFLFSYSPFFIL